MAKSEHEIAQRKMDVACIAVFLYLKHFKGFLCDLERSDLDDVSMSSHGYKDSQPGQLEINTNRDIVRMPPQPDNQPTAFVHYRTQDQTCRGKLEMEFDENSTSQITCTKVVLCDLTSKVRKLIIVKPFMDVVLEYVNQHLERNTLNFELGNKLSKRLIAGFPNVSEAITETANIAHFDPFDL